MLTVEEQIIKIAELKAKWIERAEKEGIEPQLPKENAGLRSVILGEYEKVNKNT